jgi:two-component system CheB/CheR fusion protein
VALLHARTKFDFSGYKTGTLRRRIQRRMSLKHLGQMPKYVELLRSDPAEVTALFKDLLINVTSFFREPAAWQMLRERVIRRLVAEKAADTPLRVWIPACATGEEAYSLAMVLTGDALCRCSPRTSLPTHWRRRGPVSTRRALPPTCNPSGWPDSSSPASTAIG